MGLGVPIDPRPHAQRALLRFGALVLAAAVAVALHTWNRW